MHHQLRASLLAVLCDCVAFAWASSAEKAQGSTPTPSTSSIDSNRIVGWIDCGGVVVGSTVGESDKFDVQGSDGPDSAFLFRVDEATRVTFSTCNQNTDFDTKLQVIGSSPLSSNAFGFNDDSDAFECGQKSVLAVALRPATYIVVVDGFRGAAGSYEVAMICQAFTPSRSVAATSAPTHTLSQTQTPSQTPPPSTSKTQTSSQTPTRTASPSNSASQTPTPTPSVGPTPSLTRTGSQSASPTQTTSSSPTQTATKSSSTSLSATNTPSPSTSSSRNTFQAFFIGGAFKNGNPVSITRTQSAKSNFVIAINFPVFNPLIGDFVYLTNTCDSTNQFCLFNYALSKFTIFFDRDINCGQSSTEVKCSCKQACGTTGNPPCCANFHRPTMTVIGEFVPVLEVKDFSVRIRVDCNNAWIPAMFIGLPVGNDLFYLNENNQRVELFEPTQWATVGAPVGSGGTNIRYPFVPDNTVINNAQGANFCRPATSAIVATRSVDFTSSCSILCGYQAFGGCFCDAECSNPTSPVSGLRTGQPDCCRDLTKGLCAGITSVDTTADPCSGGLRDCDGNCFPGENFKAVGDGVCDGASKLRGMNLNCQNLRFENFDGGDCFCPPGQTLSPCLGICKPTGTENVGCPVASCSAIPNTVTDCSGRCAFRAPVDAAYCSSAPAFNNVFDISFNCVGLEQAQCAAGFLGPTCVGSKALVLGDGYCDAASNNADCLFDGGDCCQNTCVDGAFKCGSNGFNCT